MESLLSPKQIADAIGASESSVKRWCDQGLLSSIKTAGGHRRIPVQEALKFVREQNYEVVEPRILAMPDTANRRARRIEGCADRLFDALIAANELAARSIVFELYVAGFPVSQICDEVIAVAFHRIGDRWACHDIDVYQERCSCEIAMRLLHELRSKQTSPDRKLLALGSTIEGDYYSIPVTMAEIVLRSAGWDARLLGTSIPFDSLEAALRQHRPGLFWLSVSHIDDEATFISRFNRLLAIAAECDTAIVAGGHALTSAIRAQLSFCSFCDTMRHLEDCSRRLAGGSVVKPSPGSSSP